MSNLLAPEAAAEINKTSECDRPSVHLLPIEEGRRRFLQDCVPTAPVQHIDDVREVQIEPGLTGRLYRPDAGTLPLALFFHGGGWVLGSLDTHDHMCRVLAHRSGWAVLSVGYRLAPEHPYPAAVEDAQTALAWARRQGALHDLHTTHLAVVGDSAGGNIAVAVGLRAGKHSPIQLQLLFYPVTTTDLTIGFADEFNDHVLCRDELRWHQAQYLPRPTDRHQPDTSPLDCADLSQLPPTCIINAQCDPITPQSTQFASALDAAGVPVELHTYAGMIHGFAQFPDRYPTARKALALASHVLSVSFNDEARSLPYKTATHAHPSDPPRSDTKDRGVRASLFDWELSRDIESM